jgi:hypothetical protein
LEPLNLAQARSISDLFHDRATTKPDVEVTYLEGEEARIQWALAIALYEQSFRLEQSGRPTTTERVRSIRKGETDGTTKDSP